MSIKAGLTQDVKDAMRAKDSKLLTTLRLITAAIKQIEVDERIEVTDERLLAILDKMAKQRKESIAQFEKANRQDLIAQEQYELGVLQRYLPEPLSTEAINTLIQKAMQEVGASAIADMGKVMNLIKPQVQGRADMSEVSAIIKAKLG